MDLVLTVDQLAERPAYDYRSSEPGSRPARLGAPDDGLPAPAPHTRYPLPVLLETSRISMTVYKRLLEKQRKGEPDLDRRIDAQARIVADSLRPAISNLARMRAAASNRKPSLVGCLLLAAPWFVHTAFRLWPYWCRHLFRPSASPEREGIPGALSAYLKFHALPSTASLVLFLFPGLFFVRNKLVSCLSMTLEGRLKNLQERVERHDAELADDDGMDWMGVLETWRWRILEWLI